MHARAQFHIHQSAQKQGGEAFFSTLRDSVGLGVSRSRMPLVFLCVLFLWSGSALAADAVDSGLSEDGEESVWLKNIGYWGSFAWLDPPGEKWRPRTGQRSELTLLLGGEAALGELGDLERLPTLGGMTIHVVGRHYPIQDAAIALGVKSYFGVDRPAAGTTAASVLVPFAGVRWVLVRENRFSLMADVQSGPAFFVFADLFTAPSPTWALGGEGSIAFPLRYSIGDFTAELRPFVGGRVGSAAEVGRPRFEVGPFSALYAGADFGLTWSFPPLRGLAR